MIPDDNKIFWLVLFIVLILLGVGIREGMSHETHVSRPESKLHTNVTIAPCPILSGYVVQSDQRRCFIAYMVTDLAHSAVHIQDLNLNEDGECVCPTIEGKN